MKRTLLEILGFTAALFLFATIHHRVVRLDDATAHKEREMAELRLLLHETRSRLAGGTRPVEETLRALAEIDGRLAELDGRVGEVSSRMSRTDRLAEDQTMKLASEVTRTREAVLADVRQTRQLLEAESRRLEAKTRTIENAVQEQSSMLERLTVGADRERMRREMLEPTVQLQGEETVGSGTIIYSREARRGTGHETYVITAYHVVRNILSDPGHRRDRGIQILTYAPGSPREAAADMVVHNERIDVALLKLRETERFPHVARLASPQRAAEATVFTGIYAVGCPLGNEPIPTGGFVASLSNHVGGSNYWMINAPTYFGNSGGGIYLESSYELVAVFSKIYTHGRSRPVVITHMGLATPLDLIARWLVEEDHGFLLEQQEPPGGLRAEAGADRPGAAPAATPGMGRQ